MITCYEEGEKHQQWCLLPSLSCFAPSTFWQTKLIFFVNQISYHLNKGGQVKCAGSAIVSSSALNGLKLSHLQQLWMFSLGDVESWLWYLITCLFINIVLQQLGKPNLHTSASSSRGMSLKSGNGAMSARSTGSWYLRFFFKTWDPAMQKGPEMFHLTPCLILSATIRPSSVCLSINGYHTGWFFWLVPPKKGWGWQIPAKKVKVRVKT